MTQTRVDIIADRDFTRRTLVGGAAGLAALHATGASALALPASPATLGVIDVGGAPAPVRKPLENFTAAKPARVSKFTFAKAPAPELPCKIKAMQDTGRVDIDLVPGGMAPLPAGIDQKFRVDLLPGFAANLPKPEDIYLKGAPAYRRRDGEIGSRKGK